MPIKLVLDDITKVEADAIVNSTNRDLVARGKGLDGSIHAAAGPELDEELEKIGHCELGEAVITGSYWIKTCKYIIHTVAPKFYNWERNEEELLQSCYKNIFRLADEKRCKSVAMPILSAGQHGMPEKDAYDILLECARKYILKNMKRTVYIVLYNKDFVDQHKIINVDVRITEKYRRVKKALIKDFFENGPDDSVAISAVLPEEPEEAKDTKKEPVYKQQELGFAQMCRWWIKKNNMSPGDFYSWSGVKKSTFSYLKIHPEAVPKKTTVFACCIGLGLNYEESKDLMRRAGYSFSKYYKLDRKMRDFITSGEDDIEYITMKILEETGINI